MEVSLLFSLSFIVKSQLKEREKIALLAIEKMRGHTNDQENGIFVVHLKIGKNSFSILNFTENNLIVLNLLV